MAGELAVELAATGAYYLFAARSACFCAFFCAFVSVSYGFSSTFTMLVATGAVFLVSLIDNFSSCSRFVVPKDVPSGLSALPLPPVPPSPLQPVSFDLVCTMS